MRVVVVAVVMVSAKRRHVYRLHFNEAVEQSTLLCVCVCVLEIVALCLALIAAIATALAIFFKRLI